MFDTFRARFRLWIFEHKEAIEEVLTDLEILPLYNPCHCGPCATAPVAPAAPSPLDPEEPEEPEEPAPGDLGKNCVIFPHLTPQPDPLTIDLHTAVMHVLQRPAHRDRVDIRDPMDVVILSRRAPDGHQVYATVVRWYTSGERPLEDLDVVGVEDELPLDPAALPRLDGGIRYEPPLPSV